MSGLLIIDDEEGIRRALKKALEHDGYRVFLAENGRKAIDFIREGGETIEIVVSDFKMPGMDGLETLIEIGKINAEITRIMLTGYATLESAIESVNTGIDGFLVKPFKNNELRLKVRECNLRKRLKQFVSEEIFKALRENSTIMSSRKQKVTVLFTDIRGFSSMSEKVSAERISEMLNNHYFSPLDSIICDYGGTLDKHIGDSIMGIFGAPLSRGDDVLSAVQCALRMREEMNVVNRKLAPENCYIPVGIGIGTGEVMAGVFGSPRKKEYTVMGTPVNLAARLERQAEDGQILICDETFQEVQERIVADEIGPRSLKGIEREVLIYNLVGLKE